MHLTLQNMILSLNSTIGLLYIKRSYTLELHLLDKVPHVTFCNDHLLLFLPDGELNTS